MRITVSTETFASCWHAALPGLIISSPCTWETRPEHAHNGPVGARRQDRERGIPALQTGPRPTLLVKSFLSRSMPGVTRDVREPGKMSSLLTNRVTVSL